MLHFTFGARRSAAGVAGIPFRGTCGAGLRCDSMRTPHLPSSPREDRLRRTAARQNLCLVKSRRRRRPDQAPVVNYALTDPFGGLGPSSRAFGFDKRGLPAVTLDEIETYLKEEGL